MSVISSTIVMSSISITSVMRVNGSLIAVTDISAVRVMSVMRAVRVASVMGVMC